MLMIKGKSWGTTQCIFKNESLEMHCIRVIGGGYCSIHKHMAKSNIFHVVSGLLTVSIFREVDGVEIEDAITLLPGFSTIVMPGEKHKFSTCCDTVAIEIYQRSMPNGLSFDDDIIRFSQGGIENYEEDIAAETQRPEIKRPGVRKRK